MNSEVCFSPTSHLKTPEFAKLSACLFETLMCTAIFKTKKWQHAMFETFFLAFPLSWSVNKNKTARLKTLHCVKRNTI